MVWLTIILHLFIGATLAGVGIVVLLVTGQGGVWPLVGAVLGGFVLGFPAARVVARVMDDTED
ncbi:CTP synthetase [Roseovarius sp. SYSU LYC5161]|uniref:CTP synthetase n=1 Tax=Roseovarius halophilus (ex Wu et al. 2025) TaxID=3376060 RepID=UPI002870DF08|nr:CTP synthetase [Roseovarius sp.]